jgi:hypothetical protein
MAENVEEAEGRGVYVSVPGAWLKMLKKLKGAAFTFPFPSTVVTSAIGRGRTVFTRSLYRLRSVRSLVAQSMASPEGCVEPTHSLEEDAGAVGSLMRFDRLLWSVAAAVEARHEDHTNRPGQRYKDAVVPCAARQVPG